MLFVSHHPPRVNFLLPVHFYLFIFGLATQRVESYFPDHASCSGRRIPFLFLSFLYIYNLFILAMLGLRCCAGFSPVVESRGHSPLTG